VSDGSEDFYVVWVKLLCSFMIVTEELAGSVCRIEIS
jgi:hypothetical protein